ncbi:hypothetical protein B0H14DRAFT_3856136 [Mycena olivaceomarginata]|nr:hypothetical protein B0H14DRAFT_3856136 [Mycena olivaceomarginata]
MWCLRNYPGGVPAALPSVLGPQIKSFLSQLSLLALLFELARPSPRSRVTSSDVYRIAHSPLVSSAALDSLLSFCATLVSADHQIATHLVPSLVIAAEKAPSNAIDPSLCAIAHATKLPASPPANDLLTPQTTLPHSLGSPSLNGL